MAHTDSANFRKMEKPDSANAPSPDFMPLGSKNGEQCCHIWCQRCYRLSIRE
jgi:hypothetical protein